MKHRVIYFVMLGLIGLAYFNAQSKLSHTIQFEDLKLGMTPEDLEDKFGTPSSTDRNQLTYIFEDASELTVSLRDNMVASAKVKFHNPLKIEDPKMKQLTLVQMESNEFSGQSPSWFFAGKPQEGLIYKITSDGRVESLTWVQPFTYPAHRPKNLQALFKDFRTQHLSNL